MNYVLTFKRKNMRWSRFYKRGCTIFRTQRKMQDTFKARGSMKNKLKSLHALKLLEDVLDRHVICLVVIVI